MSEEQKESRFKKWHKVVLVLGLLIISAVGAVLSWLYYDIPPVATPPDLEKNYVAVKDEDNIYVELMAYAPFADKRKDFLKSLKENEGAKLAELFAFQENAMTEEGLGALAALHEAIKNKPFYQGPEVKSDADDVSYGIQYSDFFHQNAQIFELALKEKRYDLAKEKLTLMNSLLVKTKETQTLIDNVIYLSIEGRYIKSIEEFLVYKDMCTQDFLQNLAMRLDGLSSFKKLHQSGLVGEFHFFVNSSQAICGEGEILDIEDEYDWVVFFMQPNMLKRDTIPLFRYWINSIDYPQKDVESKLESAPFKKFEDIGGFALIGERRNDIYFAMHFSALDKWSYRIRVAQNKRDMMRLKVAAMRYRLKHGALPKSLAQLVPEFIDKIPYDQFDGEPIRYDMRKGVLYVVGPDLVDDGASMAEDVTRSELHSMGYSGDIVEKIP